MYQLYEKLIDFVKLYIVIEGIVLQRMSEIAWRVDSSGLVEECSKNEKVLDGQDIVPPVETFTATMLLPRNQIILILSVFQI